MTQLKKKEEFVWLNEVIAQSLQASLKNLETAYGKFFQKKTKFPRFKKKSNHQSFTIPQSFKIQNNLLFIPKCEGIKIVLHRPNRGKMKSLTISKTPSNKYYASILCEVKKKQLPNTNKSIGIDLGIKDFIVTSNNQRYTNPKFFKQYQKQLAIAQKHLSRKTKGSKRYEQQRVKVAKIYEKITNSRKDMQHKISTLLVQNYDAIALETLAVKNMMKNHKLAKAISDVSWSGFVSMLEYKAKWFGKKIVKIDRFYPSSKTCSKCLHVKEQLDLSERSWTCVKCNEQHDRDFNAAKNILQQGLAILSSGADDYRHGAEIRPKEISTVSPGIGVEMLKKKRIRSPKPGNG